MTKSQIKAELRRSALNDLDPWGNVKEPAFNQAGAFCWQDGKSMKTLKKSALRFFFLLVAEAL